MRQSPIWHPFTQHGLKEEIPVVDRASGAAIHTVEVERLIDGVSSWWVTTHGHCHPPIIAAIAEQAARLDQVIFANWSHQPAEDVAAELVRIMPDRLTRVFFSDSGSTSVEVALKMALGYWVDRGEARHRIVVMEHSYHGDTIGAMSVGERGVYNQAYEPLLFDVGSIPFPAEGAEQATFDALERECAAGAAAFIVEPLILGAGGMRFYSPGVLAQMHAICARHGVLFVADEVMTGWGRTGTLIACEQAGIAPDIMCLSKGLTGGAIPLAVTMASEEVFMAHYHPDRARMFFHSSSYTANPIACAAARANLTIWREEPVLDRIADLNRRLRARIDLLSQEPNVHNARLMGAIAAFELGSGQDYLAGDVPAMMRFFRQRGILLRPLGNTIYFMPPYCIGDDDIDTVFSAMSELARNGPASGA